MFGGHTINGQAMLINPSQPSVSLVHPIKAGTGPPCTASAKDDQPRGPYVPREKHYLCEYPNDPRKAAKLAAKPAPKERPISMGRGTPPAPMRKVLRLRGGGGSEDEFIGRQAPVLPSGATSSTGIDTVNPLPSVAAQEAGTGLPSDSQKKRQKQEDVPPGSIAYRITQSKAPVTPPKSGTGPTSTLAGPPVKKQR